MNTNHLQLFAFVLCALFGLSAVSAHRGRGRQALLQPETEAEAARQGKVLSLFQIVRFPNDPCIGSGSKNGTCYTSDECSSRGGTSSGSCASGYGVCCTFSVNCGASSSENCTYFESTGSESGSCTIDICRCSDNICQLRLDFNQFVISGPSTSTVTIGTELAGQTTNIAGANPVTSASQCLTDTFSVTNPGSQTPPVICGDNTGQHMYVDVCGSTCNQLTFQLGNMGMGTGLATRQWNIKITQYSCDYNNLAPDGCTQYFFGSNTNSVESFNYAGGQHLANQDQNICIRRERGNCRICWTTAQMGDFMVSGMTAMMGFVAQSMCCGYGTDGAGTMGFDCVNIPGARLPMTTSKMGPDRFCGQTGLVSVTGSTPVTVCSNRQPFNLRFLTDNFELMTETMPGNDLGFRLTYIQTNNGCN